MSKTSVYGPLFVLAMTIAVSSSFIRLPAERQKENSLTSLDLVDGGETMLCNVIVRAIHDLHTDQKKVVKDIALFLDEDCKNLDNEELIEQCHEMVAERGAKIYEHVTNGIEMSQICEKIDDDFEMELLNDGTAECTDGNGNKCQCCKMHVQKRKMRLRYIIKQMTKKRLQICERSPRPIRCRQWIKQEEKRALQRIDKICPYAVCKHLGFCETATELPNQSVFPKNSPVVDASSISLNLLDTQAGTYFSNGVCGELEQFQVLCGHLAASADSLRYISIYMAVLQNNITWIDNDLRKQVQSAHSDNTVDVCDTCKNTIQASINFYMQIVETASKIVASTCESCSEKEKCEAFVKTQFQTINTYLASLKPDEFCSLIQLCAVKSEEKCASCIQRLQTRKSAATEAINRFAVYFTDQCAKSDATECEQTVSEATAEARSFIDEFNVQDTCLAMNFCGEDVASNIEDYERAFVEEIGKGMCSMVGPLETLCQQLVQGNIENMNSVNLNLTNIEDFFTQCEEATDEENNVTATTEQCSESKDRCQCCIHRVIQKKKCLKKRVNKYIEHMLDLCKRCPAQEKCEHYWKAKKARWDVKIDRICPKKVCIRKGYCKRTETPSMCSYMGPFVEICQEAFNVVGGLFGEF